jgi:hypothetical protein
VDALRWSEYFQELAADRTGLLASVGVLCDRSSGQRRRIGRPLRAIAYDEGSEVLEVAVGGDPRERPALRYFVSAPRSVTVTEVNGERAILVDDAAGARTLIRLFHRWRPTLSSTALTLSRPAPSPARLSVSDGVGIWDGIG